MTRDRALDDPEIRADLAFRDASERDRTRTSLVHCDECRHHVKAHDLASGQCNAPGCECQEFQRGGGPTWSPSRIVERQPCAMGCGAIVDVLEAALDAYEAVNVLLRKRGQPVPKAKAFICDACKRRDDDLVQGQREVERARRRPHHQTAMTGFERPEAAKGRP